MPVPWRPGGQGRRTGSSLQREQVGRAHVSFGGSSGQCPEAGRRHPSWRGPRGGRQSGSCSITHTRTTVGPHGSPRRRQKEPEDPASWSQAVRLRHAGSGHGVGVSVCERTLVPATVPARPDARETGLWSEGGRWCPSCSFCEGAPMSSWPSAGFSKTAVTDVVRRTFHCRHARQTPARGPQTGPLAAPAGTLLQAVRGMQRWPWLLLVKTPLHVTWRLS